MASDDLEGGVVLLLVVGLVVFFIFFGQSTGLLDFLKSMFGPSPADPESGYQAQSAYSPAADESPASVVYNTAVYQAQQIQDATPPGTVALPLQGPLWSVTDMLGRSWDYFFGSSNQNDPGAYAGMYQPTSQQ